MELKAPAPLGESERKKESPLNKPTQGYQNDGIKQENTPTPKFDFSWLKLPKLNITPQKKRKIIEISLIAVPALLLLILSIMIISFVKSEPYRMSKEFLERIENRDITGAYNMTTDAYKSAETLKDFKKLTDKLNSVDISNPKEKDRYMEEIPGMGQYAHIKYKVSGYYVDITVFNDEIDWGIHTVTLSLID
ncbi:MAG: hypothetical protein RBS01_02935 [Candidatus Dojkabacteria bacterium]|jgi:hypothetical protein|nr:hypothetical protein [Candidatus Dojkabacteria bacterium]